MIATGQLLALLLVISIGAIVMMVQTPSPLSRKAAWAAPAQPRTKVTAVAATTDADSNANSGAEIIELFPSEGRPAAAEAA